MQAITIVMVKVPPNVALAFFGSKTDNDSRQGVEG
jgi:hypothetical protein